MKVRHKQTADNLPVTLLADPRLNQMAAWGRRLAALGVSPGSSGNLSCRTTGGFVITRTEAPLGDLDQGDWVLVTRIGRLADGGLEVESLGRHEPSRDASVHDAIYGRVATADAVFHLHTGALDVLTGRLGVPSTQRHFPAGTVELRREIETFLAANPNANYFVLVDHGIVSWATTVDDAGAAVEEHHEAVTALEA